MKIFTKQKIHPKLLFNGNVLKFHVEQKPFTGNTYFDINKK